jgi:hypothetical protein
MGKVEFDSFTFSHQTTKLKTAVQNYCQGIKMTEKCETFIDNYKSVHWKNVCGLGSEMPVTGGDNEDTLTPIIHLTPEAKADEVVNKNVLKKRKEKKSPWKT